MRYRIEYSSHLKFLNISTVVEIRIVATLLLTFPLLLPMICMVTITDLYLFKIIFASSIDLYGHCGGSVVFKIVFSSSIDLYGHCNESVSF
jgi:hypothetical protein